MCCTAAIFSVVFSMPFARRAQAAAFQRLPVAGLAGNTEKEIPLAIGDVFYCILTQEVAISILPFTSMHQNTALRKSWNNWNKLKLVRAPYSAAVPLA